MNNNNDDVCVTTVMVVEVLHGPVLIVRLEDPHDLDNHTTQPEAILSYVLSYHETNVTIIRTITVYGLACKLVLYHHA
jgi:hypothetical protein